MCLFTAMLGSLRQKRVEIRMVGHYVFAQIFVSYQQNEFLAGRGQNTTTELSKAISKRILNYRLNTAEICFYYISIGHVCTKYFGRPDRHIVSSHSLTWFSLFWLPARPTLKTTVISSPLWELYITLIRGCYPGLGIACTIAFLGNCNLRVSSGGKTFLWSSNAAVI